jgi:nucleolar MIF4G domain-containing protein 1
MLEGPPQGRGVERDEATRRSDRKRARKAKRLSEKQERIAANRKRAEANRDARYAQERELRKMAQKAKLEEKTRKWKSRRAEKRKEARAAGLTKALDPSEDPVTIEPPPPQKYVPPAMRSHNDSAARVEHLSVTKSVCNRLTVQNIVEMSDELTELMSSRGFSRASIAKSLCHDLACNCLQSNIELSSTTALGYAGMLRALQLQHGNGFVAEIVEFVCLTLDVHLSKESDVGVTNGALLVGLLYMLYAVDFTLVLSLFKVLLSNPRGPSIQCALTIIRVCGGKLRRECPTELTRTVMTAEQTLSTQALGGRAAILLGVCREAILGKVSAAKKAENEESAPVDEVIERLCVIAGRQRADSSGNKRALKRFVCMAHTLSVEWGYVLQSDKSPRWYMPHSADLTQSSSSLVRRPLQQNSLTDDTKRNQLGLLRQEERVIAGQRFNSEAKRQIFKCISSAADDMDCFNMLMFRDTTGVQSHDTAAVLLQCCAQEEAYNSFYTNVLRRLCGAIKRFRSLLQFALWDRFKAIRLEAVDIPTYFNVACLITTLMEERLFTLSLLRGLDLDDTNKTIGLFARVLLLRMIVALPGDLLAELFFGGDGKQAHDVRTDTDSLRRCLTPFFQKYFCDEEEAAKWIPYFLPTVAHGTVFADGSRSESLTQRIKTLMKALKTGLL